MAAFDPQGLIFAVSTGSKHLRLYDARNWERGAFNTFELSGTDSTSTGKWNCLQFSPDGKEILIGTGLETTCAIILDSFDGNVKLTLEAPESANFRYNDLTYTPDSKFIIGARSDGRLDVWTPSSSKPVVETIEGVSNDPITALAFNPKFAMLATVGDGTVIYI